MICINIADIIIGQGLIKKQYFVYQAVEVLNAACIVARAENQCLALAGNGHCGSQGRGSVNIDDRAVGHSGIKGKGHVAPTVVGQVYAGASCRAATPIIDHKFIVKQENAIGQLLNHNPTITAARISSLDPGADRSRG